MPDIFISYAREDLKLARELAYKLEAFGWQIWWDRHMIAGKDVDTVIEEKLDASRCVIVLWTPYSINSRWVKAEATEALNKEKLIPIQMGNVRLPMIFRNVNSVLWNENNEVEDEELSELMRHLKMVIGNPPTKAKSPSRPAPEPQRQKENSKGKEIPSKPKPVQEHKKELSPEALKSLLWKYKSKINYYLEPDIPNEKVRNARKICNIPYSETVLALIDMTVFGSADDCLVFTTLKMYHRFTGSPFSISYHSLVGKTMCAEEKTLSRGIRIDKTFLTLTGSTERAINLIKLLEEVREVSPAISTANALKEKEEPKSRQDSSKGISVNDLLKILEKYKGIEDFHVHPEIPEKKLMNVAMRCQPSVDERLLALIDLTVFGSADNYLAFSTQRIYYHHNLNDPSKASFIYSQLPEAPVLLKKDFLQEKKISLNNKKLSFSGTSAPIEKILQLIIDIQSKVS